MLGWPAGQFAGPGRQALFCRGQLQFGHVDDATGYLRILCEGVATSFESVRLRAHEAAGTGAHDRSVTLRRLDPRQRKAPELFRESTFITSRDVEALFGISQRASRNLLTAWVDKGFVVVADPAKKTRKYGLSSQFSAMLQ